jgi:imidazole glycerol phosphate synthase glutamine amidotransferase subunit
MQLLATQSTESPGARGLGVVEEVVTRFDEGVRVPQLGWNQVEPGEGARYVTAGWAYFANSYRMEHAPDGWLASTSVYSGRFVAAIERGSLLALQFHPELSGAWGSNVIARWLSEAA